MPSFRIEKPNIERMKRKGDINGLIQLLNDDDDYLRQEVVKSLGEIKHPISVLSLIHLLNDDNEDLRYLAAWALGEIKDPKAVNSLIKALNDAYRYVRGFSAYALGKIIDIRAVEPLESLTADYTKIIIFDEYFGRQMEKTVGQIAQESLYKIKSSFVYQEMKTRIEKMRTMRDIEGLTLSLKNSNECIRRNAAKALGEIKDQRAVDSLILALKDNDKYVRLNAVLALGEIKDLKALEHLEKLENDFEIGETVKASLDKIKSSSEYKFNLVKNYEKALRYEDAAKIYEELNMWEEAGRIRRLIEREKQIISNVENKISMQNISQKEKENMIKLSEYTARNFTRELMQKYSDLKVACKDEECNVSTLIISTSHIVKCFEGMEIDNESLKILNILNDNIKKLNARRERSEEVAEYDKEELMLLVDKLINNWKIDDDKFLRRIIGGV